MRWRRKHLLTMRRANASTGLLIIASGRTGRILQVRKRQIKPIRMMNEKLTPGACLLAAMLALVACGSHGGDSDATGSSGTSGSAGSDSTGSSGTGASVLTGSTGATLSSGCTTAIAKPAVDTSTATSFGLTTSDSYYTIDTGAGLVFKIRRGDYSASTQAPGDIASMVYNGVQYQDTTAGSQLNAGMGWLYTDVAESDVVVDAVQVDSDHIKVTATAGGMTHYYLAQRGEAKIYMGTIFAAEPTQASESFVRFIVRALRSQLPTGVAHSDITNSVATIESADIFEDASGQTMAKHYSNERLRDWLAYGATGTGVGLWVVRGNSEGMSGGPFYRALRAQGTSTQQQLTYLVNYGMAQTEDYRTGVLDTYALVFNDGSSPGPIDTSWYADMGLQGWVDASGRGTVSGAAITGMDTTYPYTVAFANATAQYWTTADAGTGGFSCAGMLPGSYTMQVFKNELAVASQTVTVSAGGTTQVDTVDAAAGDPSATTALWRIGDWDGTPAELLNGDKLTIMHPSDVRMAAWAPGTFVVGSAAASTGFPAYSWKGVNGSQVVQFELTAAQLVASRVRIGITTAYAGGRPQISVNGWTSSAPSASSQPDSRNMTVGTYRGNNTMYGYSVPATALVAGTNTLTISVISGSSGTTWLSPGNAYDAVDFVQ
jgi:rhamnogalacturonan endolyase